MSALLLNRAELSVDYAVITLGNQIANGIGSCGDSAVNDAREELLRRGTIKDIEIIAEPFRTKCTVNGTKSGELDQNLDRYPARNENISLQALNNDLDGLFRVRWRQDNGTVAAAIMNVDSLLFDLYPPALRDNASAVLALGGNQAIARYGVENNERANGQGLVFEASSSRYPVTAKLIVDPEDVRLWNAADKMPPLIGGGLAGAICGWLLALALFRPPNPVTRLREAIANGEIRPHYQPVFSLSDRRIVGCEVLVRWLQPGGAMVRPDMFIPLAESSGLIVPMTEAVLRQSLRQLHPFLTRRPGFKIAFNITPDHFAARGFLPMLTQIASEEGIDNSQIVIELTERQSIADTERAAEIVAEARALGFRLALDDTGAGHNGFGNIQDLLVDIIKIDKKFIDLIGKNPAALSIIQMLVRLAKELGDTTVAEGIETEEQLEALRSLGVDEGQGYLVAPALSAEKFIALAEENEQGQPSAAISQTRLSALARQLAA